MFRKTITRSRARIFNSRSFATEKLHKPFTPREAIEFARKHDAKFVSFRYSDLFARWHNMVVPISQLTESKFVDGGYFDGSSVRLWQSIEQSDMILVPDATTTCMDSFNTHKTVAFICDIKDGASGLAYGKDPRNIAKRAGQYLQETKIASECQIGAEAEFFIFDELRYDQKPNGGFYMYDSKELGCNSGRVETPSNTATKIASKEGYVAVRPMDRNQDIREEMMIEMQKIGLTVETGHHEVASAQHEIDIMFDTLLRTADNIMWYKYIAKNVAKKHGKIATFMPKPNYEDNGSGMHTHVSLHDASGANLMTGNSHAGLSQLALYFIGGVIKNAHALCAITNPTTNSYRRLVPGFEAPVFQAYSARNRSAFIRIPISHPKARRFEFRTPDPSSNPYLTFSAVLMAGIDGIQNKIDPGLPTDVNLYEVKDESVFKRVPHSLEHALDALAKSHDFLTAGGVFPKQLIHDYIEYKYKYEVTPNRRIPTPTEFSLYHDC